MFNWAYKPFERELSLERWLRTLFNVPDTVDTAQGLRESIANAMSGSEGWIARQRVDNLSEEEIEDRYRPDRIYDPWDSSPADDQRSTPPLPQTGSNAPARAQSGTAAVGASVASLSVAFERIAREIEAMKPPPGVMGVKEARKRFGVATSVAALPRLQYPTWRDGQLVHLALQEAYRAQFPGRQVVMDRRCYRGSFDAGFRLSDLLRSLTRRGVAPDNEYTALDLAMRHIAGAALRADIVDVTKGLMYEIKSRRGAPAGVLQLWGYLASYNTVAHLMKLRPMHEGTEWRPSRRMLAIPLPRNRVAIPFTVPQLPGLVLYDVFDRPRRTRRERQRAEAEERMREAQRVLNSLFTVAVVLAGFIVLALLIPPLWAGFGPLLSSLTAGTAVGGSAAFGATAAAASLAFTLADVGEAAATGSTAEGLGGGTL